MFFLFILISLIALLSLAFTVMFSVFGPFGVVLMHSGPLVGECFLEKYDKISFNFLVELFLPVF